MGSLRRNLAFKAFTDADGLKKKCSDKNAKGEAKTAVEYTVEADCKADAKKLCEKDGFAMFDTDGAKCYCCTEDEWEAGLTADEKWNVF